MSVELSRCLPHSGPALLITEVVDESPERSTCRARIPEDSPFRAGEPGAPVVPAFLALELGAQAAAVIEGRARATSDPALEPPIGFVVGARQARFHAAVLPADASLLVVTTLLQDAPPLRVYGFEVRHGERCLAEGIVSTYLDRATAR